MTEGARQRGPAALRSARRTVRDWNLRRKRARTARRKSGSRRTTWILGAILLVLFASFAWAQSYLSPRSEGTEISIDELAALAGEKRIVNAEFRDEDNRLVGMYAAEPVIEEPQQERGNRNRNNNNRNAGNQNRAGQRNQPEEPDSKAPEGAGTYWMSYPPSDAAFGPLSDLLTSNGARVTVDPQTSKSIVRAVSTYLLPLLILAAFFGLLFASGRGGGSGIGDVIAFGAIGKKKVRKGMTAPVTFEDVAGADEAVAELKEVVDYLKDPDRYGEIGAVPPKGVLLFGPPGCGKTLMAKAVAGEAGVPFFSVAGAEFVESLVGVGAARVRDLFQRVRAVAPAIVFIDELDAAGRKRGSGGSSGGSDEREQTLNQLLVEMDGFEVSAGIVVMGATNRPDILDPALLRPGRFDRHITVEQPDAEGRRQILELHAAGKPVGNDVDFAYLARRTPGFSGADLANVINEAALLTVRESDPEITTPNLEEAVQRVLHGPKRRGRVLTAEERLRAAYHESGHAIVAAALGRAEDVHRVTILARSKGLGLTGIHSDSEALVHTRDQLYARVVIAMSGLSAEEMVLGQPSTGSEEDLEQATEMARDMIGRFGMSPKLGRVRLLASDVDQFLGIDSLLSSVSGETHKVVDEEIKRLLDDAEQDALRLIAANRPVLDRLADRLAREETVEGIELYRVLEEVEVSQIEYQDKFSKANGNGAHAEERKKVTE